MKLIPLLLILSLNAAGQTNLNEDIGFTKIDKYRYDTIAYRGARIYYILRTDQYTKKTDTVVKYCMVPPKRRRRP